MRWRRRKPVVVCSMGWKNCSCTHADGRELVWSERNPGEIADCPYCNEEAPSGTGGA